MDTPTPNPSDIGGAVDRSSARSRKSGHIKKIKIALPLTALALTAATIFWTFISSEDIQLQDTAQILGAISKNELINPRFESIDQNDQPFTITAKRALRGETDDTLIILTEPAGDIALKSGRWVAIKANEGAYNESKQRLLLRDKVTLFDDQGYTLTTAELNIDLQAETILSDTPVYAKGPAGAITAKGLYNNNQSGVLSFTGPATLTLRNQNNNSLGDLR